MFEITGLFISAYKCATVDNTVSGFRACGLDPFNDTVFGDEDFAATNLTEETSRCYSPASWPCPAAVRTETPDALRFTLALPLSL